MNRKTASDFPPEVLRLFDGYVHGTVSRREFLDRSARYAVGGATALGFLEALSPNFAWAQQVKPDDARIKAERIEYPSPKGSGTMKAVSARLFSAAMDCIRPSSSQESSGHTAAGFPRNNPAAKASTWKIGIGMAFRRISRAARSASIPSRRPRATQAHRPPSLNRF